MYHDTKAAAHHLPYGDNIKDQSWQQPPQQGGAPIHRQLPQSFNIYSAGMWSRSYYLGTHQDQPLYYISTHRGWSGQPDVVLHNGPSEHDRPLASATLHTWSKSIDIDLPPVRQGSSTRETVSIHGWMSKSYAFSIEVSGPQGLCRENFEWKRAHGSETGMGGSWGRGKKLTRLGTGETVAVCSEPAMTMTKHFAFQYVGSGATGVLGERFAVMAAISALGLYERERRSRANANAGAAGGAAGGGA